MHLFKSYNFYLKHFILKYIIYEIFDRFQIFGTPYILSSRARYEKIIMTYNIVKNKIKIRIMRYKNINISNLIYNQLREIRI